MSNELFAPQRRIESNYRRSLRALTKQIESAIAPLDDPQDILRVLRSIGNTSVFRDYTQALARKMTTGLYSQSKNGWREAARESMKGRQIYQALRNELEGPIGGAVASQISRNAGIIQTLPQELSRQVTHLIAQQTVSGLRPKEIAQNIRKQFPQMTQNQAALIARTEVSKTQAALTEARAQSLGIDWYVWRTSGDGRVRDSHAHMNGVLCMFRSPPNPERLAGEKRHYGNYNAGEIFNCRCYAEPVVDLDFVQFPCDVNCAGQIAKLTRAQFEKVAALSK